MRIAIILAAPLVLGFAPAEQAPGSPEALPFDMPGYSKPAPLATGDLKDFVNRATCRDTIEHAREESGHPPLEERDGEAPEPMLYKAVARAAYPRRGRPRSRRVRCAGDGRW